MAVSSEGELAPFSCSTFATARAVYRSPSSWYLKNLSALAQMSILMRRRLAVSRLLLSVASIIRLTLGGEDVLCPHRGRVGFLSVRVPAWLKPARIKLLERDRLCTTTMSGSRHLTVAAWPAVCPGARWQAGQRHRLNASLFFLSTRTPRRLLGLHVQS